MSEIRNSCMEARVRELEEELERYKKAIREAEEALASAEIELKAELEARRKGMQD